MTSSPSLSRSPSRSPITLPVPDLDGRISLADLKASVLRDEYRANPVSWVTDRLGEFTWSKQQSILNSVRDHRLTAVHSCHEIGKSWVAARIAAWWIESHEPGSAFVVTSAPTGRQVKAILWREIGRAHARGRLQGRTNQTEWHMMMPAGNEEMVAFGAKPADMAPDAFQGIHALYVLTVFDEACGIPQTLWTAADTLIANEGSRFLAIGNPDDPSSEFAEVCKPGSGWSVIGIGFEDTPNFTGESVPESLKGKLIGPTWVEEKLRKWGKDNPLYIAKVLGRFPETSTGGLIPISWVRAAQERSLEPSSPIQLGVDVGGGGDQSVIVLRQGPVVRVIRRDQNPDTMETCGNVIKALKSSDAMIAKVDEIGIGRGVVDRAKEVAKSPGKEWLKGKVVGVNVGRRPKDPEAFVNLRAEGYWGLRDDFESGEIDIDPDDEDLAAQLVGLRFKRTSSGKIQIESKDEIKRRGDSSPDEADAVMLSRLDVGVERTGATWGRRYD